MKKVFLSVVALLLGLQLVSAQTDSTLSTGGSGLSSDEGVTILPEGGEWGIGISANPFLSYLGNFFNQAGNNQSPAFTYPQNPFNSFAVFGKLVKDENTAFRARFQLNVTNNGTKGISAQDVQTPDPLNPQFVTDSRNSSNTAILLGFGLEKRRGAGRLQGVYGAEGMIGFVSSKDKYSYGNAITQQFQTPTRTDFGNNITGGDTYTKEQKFGNSFLFGVRGFMGVEFFFAPKMSIGGEFGYSLGFRTAGKGSITTETYDGTANTVRSITSQAYDNGFNTTFTGIGLDNLNGAINLLFYF